MLVSLTTLEASWLLVVHDRRHRLPVETRDIGQLAQRGSGAPSNPDHVVAQLRFLGNALCAETHDGERRAHRGVIATPVLLDRETAAATSASL